MNNPSFPTASSLEKKCCTLHKRKRTNPMAKRHIWSKTQKNTPSPKRQTYESKIHCLNSFRSLWENNLQASKLKSIAAASATNAAASSVQVTCCTPTSTSGLLRFPSPSTVADITNPLYNNCSNPDPEPGFDPDPDPKSQLPCGVFTGVVTPEVTSMVNFPPFCELSVEPASVTGSAVAGSTSNRNPTESDEFCSRQASSLPQGFHVPSPPGWRMSHAPGLDRLTRCEPGDGTNGVTIDAAATGEPDKSWTVMDHPFRSGDWSFWDFNECNQLFELLCSETDDLKKKSDWFPRKSKWKQGKTSIYRNWNSPRSEISISEAELASENGLFYIPLDLKDLRATLRFTIEPEHESRVGFSPDSQMQQLLQRRRRRFLLLLLLPQLDPPVLEHTRATFCHGEIQRHRKFPQ